MYASTSINTMILQGADDFLRNTAVHASHPHLIPHRQGTASAKTSQLNPASTGELHICDHLGIPGGSWSGLDRKIENLEAVGDHIHFALSETWPQGILDPRLIIMSH